MGAEPRNPLARVLALNRTVAVVLLAVLLFGLGEELWSGFMPVYLQAQSKRLAGETADAGIGWHLLALAEGNSDAALNYVNEGEKADCEHNEGRRRNDFELRRAQIHAKRGEADAAQDVFDRLIERVPSELRYRGSAAEAMLSARQGARAQKFAEGGLAKAREQNNRDSEQYFLELAAAAKKHQ